MKPRKDQSGSEDLLTATLSAAGAAARRFFLRLREEYRAGRAGEPEAAQASPTSIARRPVAPTWWVVLGVRESAALEEITAAYRERLRKNHPDKVTHLSDRLRQVAEEETRQLNAAYEEARRVVARRAEGR